MVVRCIITQKKTGIEGSEILFNARFYVCDFKSLSVVE